MTSALVTGAGGFIGRRVVCAANSAGYSVTPIVRKSQLDDIRNVIKQDLRLPLSKLPSVDWIFHLAGTYSGADDHELQRVDLQMARNVIRCGLERPPVFLPETLIHLYAACGTLPCRAIGREPILTRQAVRPITTPKAFSNTRLKHELGLQPRYPSYSEGLEEALRGVPHHP